MMKNDYHIILVHQIPQSPGTNVLDLGIWMSLQSAVKKCHQLRRGDKDALHATVMKVWKDVASEEAFMKVFERLKKNYAVIEKSQGSNDYYEEFRGKKGMEDTAAYVFWIRHGGGRVSGGWRSGRWLGGGDLKSEE